MNLGKYIEDSIEKAGHPKGWNWLLNKYLNVVKCWVDDRNVWCILVYPLLNRLIAWEFRRSKLTSSLVILLDGNPCITSYNPFSSLLNSCNGSNIISRYNLSLIYSREKGSRLIYNSKENDWQYSSLRLRNIKFLGIF